MTARLQLTKRETLTLKPAAAPLPQVNPTASTTASAPAAKPKPHKPPKIPTPAFGKTPPELLEDQGCLLRVRLAIRLDNKNDGRSGTYHASNKFRKECELQLKAWDLAWPGALNYQPQIVGKTMFTAPVTVRVLRVLGPRQKLWDQSSGLRGNWKEIEDSLVKIGWFVDDSPAWIRRCDFDQIADDREHGPSIIIEIRAAE